MASSDEKQLKPAEAELVLRRAAELAARRRERGFSTGYVSPELLVQAAAVAGITESDARKALADLKTAKSFEPDSIPKKLYGGARLRAVREVEQPAGAAQDDLESILRLKHGLKLRQKTEAASRWDAGDVLGTVRRALDFSDHRVLFKVKSIELLVREATEARSQVYLTADFSNQRSEYLSLGGVLGASLAVPVAIAGVYNPLYFLLVPPALAAPGLGFKLAYKKACAEIRRALDAVLDSAERNPKPPEDQNGRRVGLDPVPRFDPRSMDEE